MRGSGQQGLSSSSATSANNFPGACRTLPRGCTLVLSMAPASMVSRTFAVVIQDGPLSAAVAAGCQSLSTTPDSGQDTWRNSWWVADGSDGNFAGGASGVAEPGNDLGRNSGPYYGKLRSCIRTPSFASRGNTSQARTVCVHSASRDLCEGAGESASLHRSLLRHWRPLPRAYYGFCNTSMAARQNAGRSSGLREVTKFLSTTTSASM
jgi:hypothetical protein